MKKLIEVINLVVDKYLDDITLIIQKNSLTLEYQYFLSNEECMIY